MAISAVVGAFYFVISIAGDMLLINSYAIKYNLGAVFKPIYLKEQGRLTKFFWGKWNMGFFENEYGIRKISLIVFILLPLNLSVAVLAIAVLVVVVVLLCVTGSLAFSEMWENILFVAFLYGAGVKLFSRIMYLILKVKCGRVAEKRYQPPTRKLSKSEPDVYVKKWLNLGYSAWLFV